MLMFTKPQVNSAHFYMTQALSSVVNSPKTSEANLALPPSETVPLPSSQAANKKTPTSKKTPASKKAGEIIDVDTEEKEQESSSRLSKKRTKSETKTTSGEATKTAVKRLPKRDLDDPIPDDNTSSSSIKKTRVIKPAR